MAATHQHAGTGQSDVTITASPRLKFAFVVAIVADIVQLIGLPVMIMGAESPVDDAVDLCVGGLLAWLLGWHWEFAPSFFAKLVPGVDLVPLWTLAVANVYRKNRSRVAAEARAAQ
jgi:hypothetical protein